MTFEEFLDTDRVQVVLLYNYEDEVYADTARLEDGVLHVISNRGNVWEDVHYGVPFYEDVGAKVITKETLLEM